MRATKHAAVLLLLTCFSAAWIAAASSPEAPPMRRQAGDTSTRSPGDALADELTRCLRLGDFIVHDPTCLRAWGDYGRRFLRAVPPTTGTPQQSPPQPLPDDVR